MLKHTFSEASVVSGRLMAADERLEELLSGLASPNAAEAWARFLSSYAPAILQVVKLFERDEDHVADCFLFVSERLSEKGFRRLRRFRPDGPAQFSTWLRAVVRNLCLDWHRKEFGRQRVFKSITRLGPLEQEVFRLRFVERLSLEETCQSLAPTLSPVGANEIAEAEARVLAALNERQRWLLEVRRSRIFESIQQSGESDGSAPAQILDPGPDPETMAMLSQQKAALGQALRRLSLPDRLLLRLRFEQGLALSQIARLTGRNSPQEVDRRIRHLLEKLGKEVR